MYYKSFVNVITGEIYISYAKFDDKVEGVGGWKHVTRDQMKKIYEAFSLKSGAKRIPYSQENIVELKIILL